MAMKIVILEDNSDRQAVMRACLADRFYPFDAHFFDDAREAIRFLDTHLTDTLVISLDHDLDLKPAADGQLVDPGTERDVADFLAQESSRLPRGRRHDQFARRRRDGRSAARRGWKTRASPRLTTPTGSKPPGSSPCVGPWSAPFAEILAPGAIHENTLANSSAASTVGTSCASAASAFVASPCSASSAPGLRDPKRGEFARPRPST